MWSKRYPALALALFASEAIAQNAPASPGTGTLRIVLPVVDHGCSKPGPGDDVILVCGRKDGLYRIDPTVLATVRAREALDNPPRPDGKGRLFHEACSPVGGRPCPGQGTLPVRQHRAGRGDRLDQGRQGRGCATDVAPGAE